MTPQRSSLRRRAGAMLYDSLLVLALLLFATTLFLIVQGGNAVEPYTPVHQLVMLGVIYAFFAFFWSYGGQTLGMRAWRLRVETWDGQIPTFWRATLRFVLALVSLVPFGLGFFWQLWDRDQLTLHDRYSGTQVLYYPSD